MAARRKTAKKKAARAGLGRLAAMPRLSEALARLETQLPRELRASLRAMRRQVATWEARLDRLRAERDERFAHFDAQMRRDAKVLVARLESALFGPRRKAPRRRKRARRSSPIS